VLVDTAVRRLHLASGEVGARRSAHGRLVTPHIEPFQVGGAARELDGPAQRRRSSQASSGPGSPMSAKSFACLPVRPGLICPAAPGGSETGQLTASRREIGTRRRRGLAAHQTLLAGRGTDRPPHPLGLAIPGPAAPDPAR
jgi:hypothetical protein